MLEAEKLLKSKNLHYRLIPLKEKAMTAHEVSKYSLVDLSPEEVCKTIILKTKSGKVLAVFLKGDRKIDFKKLELVVKEKVTILGQEHVHAHAGSVPGSVCPLLVKVPLYADKSVLALEKINFGSGNLMFGIEMNTGDFLELLKPEIVDVSIL